MTEQRDQYENSQYSCNGGEDSAIYDEETQVLDLDTSTDNVTWFNEQIEQSRARGQNYELKIGYGEDPSRDSEWLVVKEVRKLQKPSLVIKVIGNVPLLIEEC